MPASFFKSCGGSSMTEKNLVVITPERVYLHPNLVAGLIAQWRHDYNRKNIPKILDEIDQDLEVRWMPEEDLFDLAQFRMALHAARSTSNLIFEEYQKAKSTLNILDDESQNQSSKTQSETSNLNF
jgi:hypothetical protein